MPPATVMIIRHGEKPPVSGNGVTDQGDVDDYSLTVRGWMRAGALIGYFATPHDGIVTPEVIHAAAPFTKGNSVHGRRPLQTVTPLAQALAIPLKSGVAAGDEAALIEKLRDETRPTLISWEHHAIRAIVEGLLIPAFSTEFPDRFDLVWLFTRNGETYDFRQINQHLFVDDAPLQV